MNLKSKELMSYMLVTKTVYHILLSFVPFLNSIRFTNLLLLRHFQDLYGSYNSNRDYIEIGLKNYLYFIIIIL